jgi:hypothetical protein
VIPRSIDRVFVALEEHDCRPRGSEQRGWRAQCAAHDDHTPSLQVAYDPSRGTTALYCHAGCSTEAVLDALALDWPDLFDEWRRRERKLASREVAEREYVALTSKDSLSLTSRAKTNVSPTPNPSPSPSPTFSITTGDSPDVAALLQSVKDVEAGREQIDFEVSLPLDRLPRQATALRALAAKIAIVMGLRLTYGHTDPVPISASLAAQLMGLRDPDRTGAKRAGASLHKLERCNVIRHDSSMEPTKGMPYGTRCFQPADFDLEAVFLSATEGVPAVGARSIDADPVAEVSADLELDPPMEVGEELAMNRAEVAVAVTGAVRVVAPGDEAGGHDFDSKCTGGRHRGHECQIDTPRF